MRITAIQTQEISTWMNDFANFMQEFGEQVQMHVEKKKKLREIDHPVSEMFIIHTKFYCTIHIFCIVQNFQQLPLGTLGDRKRLFTIPNGRGNELVS